jgi:uncharacterized spore protein YtfJ
MSAKELIDGAIEHLRTSASVKTVYGDPIVTEGKTVIPVARVAFGFGGGSGVHHKPKPESNGKTSKATAAMEHEEEGEGEGAGGGVSAKPVGVVEITGQDTRFVQFGATKKLAVTALVGTALGLVAGMLLGRRSTD